MSIKAKLAQMEKLAGKVTLAHIKTMSSEELESALVHGLEYEATRARDAEHAAIIRATGKYVLSDAGVLDRNAPRLLVAALQNQLKLKDIPHE